MKIEITKETAEAILKLNDRYFFGLFKEIVTSEDEEYQLRNAITELVREIKIPNGTSVQNGHYQCK